MAIYIGPPQNIQNLNDLSLWLNGLYNWIISGESSDGVNFLQTGTSAVRTVQSKLRDYVSVKDFGAKGDGTTDDTAAIQAAVDSISFGSIFFPPGEYKLTAEIDIAKANGIRLFGAGRMVTYVVLATNTQNGFNVAQDTSVVIEDMTITASAGLTKTAGAAIAVSGTSVATYNSGSRFSNLIISLQRNGIDLSSAGAFWIENCYFLSNISSGVIVRNSANGDIGDGLIAHCQFNSADAVGPGIAYSSGGALRVIGNKFWDHGTGGLILDLLDDGDTGGLFVIGNSFDSQGGYGILLQNTAAAHTFISATIVGNQFTACTSVDIAQSGDNWLSYLTICGNNFIRSNTATSIELNGVDYATISGNVFAGQGGTSKAIEIGGDTDNINIPPTNVFYNFGTKVVNSSENAYIVTANITQGTAAPIAGTWAVGDICWNTTPSAEGVPGWVCTTAGAPGTWKAMAALAA